MSDSIPRSVTNEDLRRGGHEPIPEDLPVDLDPARIAEIIEDELSSKGIPFQALTGGFVIINTDGQGVGRIGNNGNVKIFPRFVSTEDSKTFVKISRLVWRAVQAEQWRENHFKEAADRYATLHPQDTAVPSPGQQQAQGTAVSGDAELELAQRAKKYGVTPARLSRWDRIHSLNGLTIAQIAERESVEAQTIKKDKKAMKEKGYAYP